MEFGSGPYFLIPPGRVVRGGRELVRIFLRKGLLTRHHESMFKARITKESERVFTSVSAAVRWLVETRRASQITDMWAAALAD